MPTIRSAWQAFPIYILWGIGSGAFWPAQSSLLAGLTPPTNRHAAFATQRLVMNLGVAFGGVIAGVIASVSHPESFTVLFVVNGLTFLAYIVILVGVRAPELHPERASGRWGQVLRHRTFVSYTALNAVFMASAMAVMVELLPPFAKNVAHVSEQEVGVIFAITS